MMKLTTYFVVAMGVLSSASNAQEVSGLEAIYSAPEFSNEYYVEEGVNTIRSGEIDDVRLFTVGDQYWMTVYADKDDANSQYTGVFKSNVSDGIDGLFATARNSGYRQGINILLNELQESIGSEYFVMTELQDGVKENHSWTMLWGDKAADWLEDYQGTGFTFDDIEYNSGSTATSTYNLGTQTYVSTTHAQVLGNMQVIDPEGNSHIISYNQTVYEDGSSYGIISQGELTDMLAHISNELTDKAFEAGWDNGYDAGFNDGYEIGFNHGYSKAISDLRE